MAKLIIDITDPTTPTIDGEWVTVKHMLKWFVACCAIINSAIEDVLDEEDKEKFIEMCIEQLTSWSRYNVVSKKMHK